jgi:pilus assembly protein CpaE
MPSPKPAAPPAFEDDFDFDFDVGDTSATAPRAAGRPAPRTGPAPAPTATELAGDGSVEFNFGNGGDVTVPRISICAFLERPDTQRLVEQSAADRRLQRARVQATGGGIQAAIEHLATQPTPDLLLIESSAPPARLIADLERVAEHCDPKVKVVIIGAKNDILLYRELMRRGVSEYLVPPLQPVQLIRAIGALYVDPDKPFVGKTVAVMGVKGGVGASTIAHNLAWAIAENLQINTTLVDLDLSFGTTGLDFNQDSQQGVAEALADPERIDDVVLDRLVVKASERLSLFTAPARVDRMYDHDADAYETVVERVRRTVPWVVIDLPHAWNAWTQTILRSADEIVLVSGPDLASLRNAKNLVDVLRSGRPNDKAPRFVVNMTGIPKRPEVPVKEFAGAVGLDPVLVLPFEPGLFGQATNNGQMLSEIDPASKSAAGIDHLAQTLTGRALQTKPKAGLGSLLKLKR